MNYKKNHNKKTFLLIICLILSIILFYNYKYFLLIKKPFYEIGASINEFFLLKKDPLSDEIIIGINKELENENNNLKELLNIDTNNYHFIPALVIKRDNTWYNELTINKGKKDNIEVNMVVIDNNSLIGRVKEVYSNFSIIDLITSNSPSMKVSVDIKNNETYHGILNSFNNNNGYLTIDNIIKNSEINIGDKVYTNGLGGLYPSGIYIGNVSKVYYDNLGLNKKVDIKVNNNFNNIRYIYVIGR